MSDKRIVAGDNKIAERDMSVAAAETYRLLEALTKDEHKGRGDTWEAARGRVADAAGVPISYAARIWHRWKNMKKADGDALLALQKLEQRISEARKAHADYREETTRLVAMARAKLPDHIGGGPA